MSTAKHSPAPWRVAPDFSDGHGQFSIVDAEGCEVGSAEAWIGEHRAEAEANAHVFAAGPELLVALKALLPAYSAIRKGGYGDRVPDNNLEANARAAIAKAEAPSQDKA